MKLHLQAGEAGKNVIQAVTPGQITISGQAYTRSLIVSAARILPDWPPANFAALTAEHLRLILSFAAEIVLLGTGDKQFFPHPELLRDLYAAKIGVEVMTTAAACRTYNVLLSEDRKVAAALMIDPVSK